ncbi:hypothetical protein MKZ08_07380 [Viridibacillus sp. FSL R5-0477]|uniref:Uncharacterized protein n=1 Tax=Viridibacillus arenosi FSL R5-213 TaxID=1227360 RepID=W4EYL3_9BACL|nr:MULTISPECIES: hypothetical protein [Viridibacillus]ETT85314.1 hypothetical protein C176_11474 [Viridibacillus arenosi FSL R5-213]OMC80966.1 hypothetical protein BK130_16735 [Viridibacillus sp. FSL H8-0123]OMC86599.1 hypothetical protein BK128_11100 [Viridibacillus sp. FSL H7-0596]OMC89375.1 hypothetical protein BK137_18185 [Viridibacillus arenosi]
MKRNSIEQSSNNYNEQLFSIDEQICTLLKQRKDLSMDHPVFPPDEVLSKWATKYDLYEEYLSSLFGTVRMHDFFKPQVEPSGFRKHLPVLKSVEVDEKFYTVTFIRQYENASIVHLNIDWNETIDTRKNHQLNHNHFALSIGQAYDCRNDRASGSTGNFMHSFIVSPPVPDDISGMTLVFTEYSDIFNDKATGLEIAMHLE